MFKKHLKTTIVEQKLPKTKLHYTATPIGGEKELKAWKQEQLIKEAQWQAKIAESRKERRDASINIIKGESKPVLTYLDMVEMQFSAHYNTKNLIHSNYLPYTQPKKSFINKVKEFCIKAFSNTFFN